MGLRALYHHFLTWRVASPRLHVLLKGRPFLRVQGIPKIQFLKKCLEQDVLARVTDRRQIQPIQPRSSSPHSLSFSSVLAASSRRRSTDFGADRVVLVIANGEDTWLAASEEPEQR